ncbi:non-ribosomal peptide synthetase [Nocardia terpenica]|uniref:Amino acid adenylation domain-containing protein n=1 Tax=Nocardia terpenica TaxID=455432 RepID=A0A6G9Z504_9NOCA|nr:non-ribosomal peptide synthetase [Nocardia terpenica]QIS20093.1 amino acid adenylation domain-containing protein [Nocardia terpenica]
MSSDTERPTIAGVAGAVHGRAQRAPEALAVVEGDQRLGYAALDAFAAAAAESLSRTGIRPGDAVAVALPRGWRLIATMLGILRIGAQVVPLDTQSPAHRRAHILTDSGAVALVHGPDEPDAVPDGVHPVPVSTLFEHEPADPWSPAPPAQASFLFYTSGTTGRPKGVEVRDAGILRLALPGSIDLAEGARYACLSNPAFDAMSFEVWVPLLTGGCCVILDEETVATPHRLAAALLRERIDTLWMTAALFNAVVDAVPACFAGAAQVLIGGEQLNAAVIRRWYRANPDSSTVLYNGYGPTETTTFALSHPIPRDFAGDVVPIGRPLPATTTAIVVPGTERLSAPGEVGELYLAGDGLAAGYRNLPEETERRFVRLPWLDGERYYRTGDLVRTNADGAVEYIGRTDRQVKVRGFRIEPGEVERQLAAHPAVRQAYVCTRREGEHGPHQLLGYLVADVGLSYDEFERHIADRLPTYMRPHRLYLLDALPLNANGKIDHIALAERTDEPWRRTGTDEATTDWEREVLDLAAQTLGIDPPRPGDRWIACGGDSLQALRLRFAVHRRWGCEISRHLVLHSTFRELAAAIAEARSTGGFAYPDAPAPSRAISAPLTSEQQRLWFQQQWKPGSRAYNVPLAFRIDGAVDVARLRHALRSLVVRHPALRAAFESTTDGPRQVVGEPYDPWIEADPGAARDESARRAFADRFFAVAFDLRQPRMLHACWLPHDNGGTLLLRLHHIAVDGWSLSVLFRDLSQAYSGESEPTDARTPLDYAGWQSDWFATDAYRTQVRELRNHYARFDETEPLRPIHERPFSAGRMLHTTVDVTRRARLDRVCAETGLTRFQVLLAVFGWSFYAVTGHTRPRIAAPVANRPIHEFEASVGMFANTVLLPVTVEPLVTMRDQLTRLGADTRAVLDRQDVALADVLADRESPTGTSPFDVLFVLENTDFGALALAETTARPLWWAPAEAKTPMTVSVIEHAEGFDCLWEYAEDYFDAEQVAALAELFRHGLNLLCDGGIATPATLAQPYRAALPDTSRGPAAEPTFSTVAEGFAWQVALTPAAVALRSHDRDVTYAELDTAAALLAHALHSEYDLPDEGEPCRVALYFEPSIEHVVSLLALARLGVTAVPLDPSYPPALLRQILAQVRPLCVLLAPDQAEAFDTVDSNGVPRHLVTDVLGLTGDGESRSVAPFPTRSTATRPMYTLFTSGSTGTPKGVQVPDSTLCNLLQWQSTVGGLSTPAVTQQFSMLSFDVSFQEIFTTLCGGGTLHLVRPEWRRDIPALLDQLDGVGIERIFLPYVALQLLAEHGVRLGRYPRRLREVITAGEQLVCTDAIRRWFAGLPGARLFNHYGPTETHVVSSLCLDGDPVRWPDRPAIGHPIAQAVLRVVDSADLPVPPGVEGRLLLGGAMVNRCYLGDPASAAPRFEELPGIGLCYRSGDRARVDADGLVHYAGRDDQQIKLSGHRVELGQIEAALLRHPAIVHALVVQDGTALVACLQCRTPEPTVADLTAHVADLLPAHVRIDRFRILTELPRTPSGKLDRRNALRAPGRDLSRSATGPVTWSATEATLAGIFEAATGSPITPDQTFFQAGATSLGLMRFHLRCTADPTLRFTVADLFEHVTIPALAAFVDRKMRDRAHAQTAIPTSRTETTRVQTDSETVTSGRSDVAEPIAVVGMAVRLPGATDLGAFWDLVRTGRSGIEYFAAPEGVVGARSQMDGLLAFDPEHFGINRRDAALMDPQQRHLLMSCVQALAHAGIADPAARRIGLVAGCGENTYFQTMLREADPTLLPDGFQLAQHHDKDFLATKAAYHLGLTGPAFTTQAACASSLVAVHLAAGLLRQGDAEVMLAGGVLVDTTLTDGYRYRPQHIFSVDGHCRPFSDDASGTIGGSGVGVVVLKPLRAARRDGDTVYAVVTGSAVNNDGSAKLGYSAPSLAGQREVVRTALRRSGRRGTDIGYVEAHGTGTRLGDPVEVGALRQALELGDGDNCALSSVKSQLGHLGAAAGVIGFIRAVLAVRHGIIPPTIDFRAPNPQLAHDFTAFSVPTTAIPWPSDRDRVAGVSSFGIGGANAHVIVEGLTSEPSFVSNSIACLLLSSSSEAGLRADAARIANYLAAHPDRYTQVLRHLQAGRPARRYRMAAVCSDADAAVAWLGNAAEATVHDTVEVAVESGATVVPSSAAPDDLVDAWLAGAHIDWPAGSAAAPWDFPPPAFDLTDYNFQHAKSRTSSSQSASPAPSFRHAFGPNPQSDPGQKHAGIAGDRRRDGTAGSREVPIFELPERLPEGGWLAQPMWVRLRRAGLSARRHSDRVLVVMSDARLADGVLADLSANHRRVVEVCSAESYSRRGEDLFELDPADGASLGRLFADLGEVDGIDWLHALPLAVAGAIGVDTLDLAYRACVDTPAAVLRAVADSPVAARFRAWWLSAGAQSVDGLVRRPESGLLAGIAAVGPQEIAVPGHWVDLPDGDLPAYASVLAELLAADDVPKKIALHRDYWWEQSTTSVTVAETELPRGEGAHVILGGTGGIGVGIATWLLEHTDGDVVLLARRAQLPDELTPWADRVQIISADLTETAPAEIMSLIQKRITVLHTVTHAAGVAAGGLIARRDSATAKQASAVKLLGALLMEQIIDHYRPAIAVYCSSMSARFGGIGQLDYAAANGLLDGFAHHRARPGETTVRIGIDWDIWSETGMAVRALHGDARHRAHLSVGLTVAEGQRVFARALTAQLPQLLVSTTPLTEAHMFYAPTRDTVAEASANLPSAARLLTEFLCDALGLEELDPDASLYDLGADSLTMLDVIDAVKQHLGIDLELSRLSHRVSLAEILARVTEAAAGAVGAEDVSVQVWQEGTGREVLCLIHPVGGDIQAYRPLVSGLAAELTVCLIADPALRDTAPPAWTLTERARLYHAALQARFPVETWRWQLAGWSFGAWVALGMAAESEAAGQPARALHLIDPPPPGAGARFRDYDRAQLAAVFAHELGQSGDSGTHGYAERLARCCEANLRSMIDHRLPRLTRTPSRVWLAERPLPDLPGHGNLDAQQADWVPHLPESTAWHRLDTTHYGIVRPPQVNAVAAAVNATLGGADS